MKERPILMNGEMVRAILDGRKNQTRRALKVQPRVCDHSLEKNPAIPTRFFDMGESTGNGILEGEWACRTCGNGVWCNGKEAGGIKCPQGKPGDRLWVRENFKIKNFLDADISNTENGYECNAEAEATVLYTDGTERRVVGLVDNEGVKYDIDEIAQAENFSKKKCWNPSIHMPRWASRIILEIVSVRVDRLQDISEEDAEAEGVKRLPATHARGNFWETYFPSGIVNGARCQYFAKDSFKTLWESINGPGSWEKNPWVWVIEFKRVTHDRP